MAALLIAVSGDTMPNSGCCVAQFSAAAFPVTVQADSTAPVRRRIAQQDPVAAWPGEDRFRHAAVSWAAAVFTYAGVRVLDDDRDTAMTVALPLAAALGLGKEVADSRRGGAFSAGDLVADALGVGAAWLFLREVR